MKGKLLTVPQAAERLNCSISNVYNMCSLKMLGHVRIGAGKGGIRISEEHIEAFLKASECSPVDRQKEESKEAKEEKTPRPTAFRPDEEQTA